jgi:hypothetical protein
VVWPYSYQLKQTARTLVPLDDEADAVLLHLINSLQQIKSKQWVVSLNVYEHVELQLLYVQVFSFVVPDKQ